MQLVKGKTHTELIPKKGMSLNKLFEAAIQILEGRSQATRLEVAVRQVDA
jgi:hypothetical protein